MTDPVLIVPFQELGRSDIAPVGGKNASLRAMVRTLGAGGVRVPPGFATTAVAAVGRGEAGGGGRDRAAG